MANLFNRVKVATATTGTGTVTLGAADSGAQTFAAAGVATGTTVPYVIEDGTAWEVGKGVYTSAGTTLSRTLIASSTGALLNLSGSAKVFVAPSAVDIGAPVIVDVYQANAAAQTWTKRDGLKAVKFICVGAGGGGGSGRRGAAATVRGGGAGGGGGGYGEMTYEASAVPATLSVGVCFGGFGGAAKTVDSTNGASGVFQTGGGAAQGNTVVYDSTVSAFGSNKYVYAFAPCGGGGNAGGTTVAGGGSGGTQAMWAGAAGGAGSATGFAVAGSQVAMGASGGGGGGGLNASDSGQFAGTGGSGPYVSGGGFSPVSPPSRPTTDGGSPAAIPALAVADVTPGAGGSGGSYGLTAAAGTGAAGQTPGGGGGGGGGSLNGFNSGAGGNGGDGRCIAINFF